MVIRSVPGYERREGKSVLYQKVRVLVSQRAMNACRLTAQFTRPAERRASRLHLMRSVEPVNLPAA